MTEAIMAHPALRHPFEKTSINDTGATLLASGKTIKLAQSLVDGNLWVTPEDLTRINGFELKPQGACYQELCIPIKEDSELLRQVSEQRWFNLTAFADLLEQPYVADTENRIWSFAQAPAKRSDMMANAMAPDFELTDRQGKVVRMSDFKGKKALIITWSSW